MPLALLLPPAAVALFLRACSWSNSRSSSRCVSASFCWIARRSREFSVFFSSSAAISCRCISSSWFTYSSHLREERERGAHYLQQVEPLASDQRFPAFPRRFSRWEDEFSTLLHQTTPTILCAPLTTALTDLTVPHTTHYTTGHRQNQNM